jgi:acyl-CoA synthetase (AMP-forming)/AMP-acid ligase II
MKELIYSRLLGPAARQEGKHAAVIDGTHRATLEEHVARVHRLCRVLRDLGVGPGDRFAVMALNSHAFVELYHAAYLGAGIINPLNLRLAGKELDYILRDSGTEVVFVDQTFLKLIRLAIDLGGAESKVRKLVLIGEPADDSPKYDARYEDLLRAAEPLVPEEPEETDAVVLMYTGGTTGLPKGVLLNQRAEMLNTYHVMIRMGWMTGEVTLVQTPMFHAASMVSILSGVLGGSTIITMPMFSPDGAMRIIEEHQVTITTMVPTMIGMMFQHPEFRPERLRSLRVLSYGASPMPEAILKRLLEYFPLLGIQQGYGMTESASVLTLLTVDDHKQGGERLRSAGRAVPGVELCIQNAAGKLLPPREIGEVCARGGNFMTGYWKKEEATNEAFRDGWYHTGDAGYLDEAGYLFLVDRVKDMIVTGGENVYSAEVESAISTHASVAQVAVIGIPHDVWGEQVHAIVVLRAGATATVAEIQEHARANIAGYKVPKSVEFRAAPLPLSGAMKILKRELREPYWKGHTRRIN